MSRPRISITLDQVVSPGYVPYRLGTDPEKRRARLAALPWGDGTVEEIILYDCLHVVGRPDGLRLLRECRRVLRPGGLVWIRVPRPDLPREPSAEAVLEVANRLAFEGDWAWFFTRAELERAVELAGLERPPVDGGPASPPSQALSPDAAEGLWVAGRRRPAVDAFAPPLVSLLIPAYKATWFEECLRSACAQTYEPLEIVVCDDSPDEAIARITESIGDPRVRYERNPGHLGGRATYRRCVELARGAWLKFLNDDDLLHPDCVRRLVDAVLAQPDARLVSSTRRVIDAQGREQEKGGLELPGDAVVEGRSLAQMLLALGQNLVGEPTTTLFRRSDVRALHELPFSLEGEPLPGIGDLGLWVRLLGQGDCVYLAEPLSSFRVHRAQRQRDPEVMAEVGSSWRRLRERAAALGLFDPQGAEHELRWRPLKGGTWRSIPWAQAVACAGAGRADPEALHGALQPVIEEEYALWCEKHSLEVIEGEVFAERMMLKWRSRPSFHLLVYLEAGEESRLADTLDSLAAQLYPHWGLSVLSRRPCPQAHFEELPNLEWIQLEPQADPVAVANLTVAQTGADWVAWLPAGIRLAPELLIKCGDYTQIRPGWRAIYTDSDRLDPAGRRHDPRFRPDFNPDLLRSMPYLGPLCLIQGEALLGCGGFDLEAGADPALQAYALAFRIQETFGPQAVGHIAGVLYHEPADGPALPDGALSRPLLASHLARSGVAADLEPGRLPGVHRVRYRHARTPLVSIVIHTRDKLEFLEPCVESLLEKTRYAAFEVIVVDNQSEDPDTLAYLERLARRPQGRIRVLRYPHPFNYAAQSNLAAAHAQGEYLLFLNNDTQIVQPEWLDEMMIHAQRPEVGVVGARLVFPETGRIQHAGCILGMGAPRLAGHPYAGVLGLEDPGYLGRAQAVQNYSAVTGACLLVRKALYERVGGMDETRFGVLYNDVDLCLRISEQGARVVWTPDATVVHHGSASLRPALEDPVVVAEHQRRTEREDTALLERWGAYIAGDPAYNPHLSLSDPRGVVESEVVVNWDVNFHDRPRVLGVVSGGGSGEYRVIQPLRAVSRAGLAQTDVVQPKRYLHTRIPTLAELVRSAPDTLLVHAALADHELELLERVRSSLDMELVYGLDDLVTAVPEKSSAYKRFTGCFRDARRRLRTALRACHRAVVTTEPLARLCGEMIDDVRVVPNYLERSVWEKFTPLRRERGRARVGWAGAQQHQGDLELMLPVVQATAGEVDWVFFGMCPEALEPYAAEVHEFRIGFEDYVAGLARLDLDLAVAPLEINPFNEAKSNLRILEYGFFGWPVVCTDILPYQQGPVTRVPNDPARWIEAIRERVHDPDAARAEGARLRRWVLEHWMLEDHVEAWARVLTAAPEQRPLRVAAGS